MARSHGLRCPIPNEPYDPFAPPSGGGQFDDVPHDEGYVADTPRTVQPRGGVGATPVDRYGIPSSEAGDEDYGYVTPRPERIVRISSSGAYTEVPADPSATTSQYRPRPGRGVRGSGQVPSRPRPRPAPRARGGGPSKTRSLAVTALGVVLLVLALVFGYIRVSAARPDALVSYSYPEDTLVSGKAAPVTFSTSGQSAVAIPSIGFSDQSGTQQMVPIASMTKIMTAFVVLHDHPIKAGSNGPKITLTATDVTDYDEDTGLNEASIEVEQGERLTERQLIDGMLIHSANNFADTLARWDAGSVTSFVTKMNFVAGLLKMDQTHYSDASGYDANSQSTPADQLKVAARAMAIPAFAAAVDHTSVTLPLAGTVASYTPLVGTNGVVGVKSGFTSQALGCDVMAAYRQVDGVTRLVLAATTGQGGDDPLATAGLIDLHLIDVASAGVAKTTVSLSTPVATVTGDGGSVKAYIVGSGTFYAVPGTLVAIHVGIESKLPDGTGAGTVIGHATFTVGSQVVTLPVELRQSVPSPSFLSRLL